MDYQDDQLQEILQEITERIATEKENTNFMDYWDDKLEQRL